MANALNALTDDDESAPFEASDDESEEKIDELIEKQREELEQIAQSNERDASFELDASHGSEPALRGTGTSGSDHGGLYLHMANGFRTPQPSRAKYSLGSRQRNVQTEQIVRENNDRMRLAELFDGPVGNGSSPPQNGNSSRLNHEDLMDANGNASGVVDRERSQEEEVVGSPFYAPSSSYTNNSGSMHRRRPGHPPPYPQRQDQVEGRFRRSYSHETLQRTLNFDEDDEPVAVPPPPRSSPSRTYGGRNNHFSQSTSALGSHDAQKQQQLDENSAKKLDQHVRQLKTTIHHLNARKQDLQRNQAEFDRHADCIFPSLDQVANFEQMSLELSRLVQNQMRQSQVNVKEDPQEELKRLQSRVSELEAELTHRKHDIDVLEEKRAVEMSQFQAQMISLVTSTKLTEQKVELFSDSVKRLQEELKQMSERVQDQMQKLERKTVSNKTNRSSSSAAIAATTVSKVDGSSWLRHVLMALIAVLIAVMVMIARRLSRTRVLGV